MGYYNDHYPKSPRKKNRRWLIPILLGIIRGILLVVVVMRNLMNSNLHDNREEVRQSDNGNNVTNKQVNVDVSTQITDVVGKVSPAVVGVTNIQRSADFWQQQEVSEAGSGSGVIYKKEDG